METASFEMAAGFYEDGDEQCIGLRPPVPPIWLRSLEQEWGTAVETIPRNDCTEFVFHKDDINSQAVKRHIKEVLHEEGGFIIKPLLRLTKLEGDSSNSLFQQRAASKLKK